jgi:hypothetical protein
VSAHIRQAEISRQDVTTQTSSPILSTVVGGIVLVEVVASALHGPTMRYRLKAEILQCSEEHLENA